MFLACKKRSLNDLLQDLRLVRDKFTHVSRGFAFVHFHSVRPLFYEYSSHLSILFYFSGNFFLIFSFTPLLLSAICPFARN